MDLINDKTDDDKTLECLKYLHDKGFTWSGTTCDHAAVSPSPSSSSSYSQSTMTLPP